MAGLAVGEGAALLTLDVLAESEARQLLTDRLGAERVAAEPTAVGELIGLCARLPLALSIAAARAVSYPTFALSALAAELRDAAWRLDGLDAGDTASNIRAVFSWSYLSLGDHPRWMFRLLGLHAGPWRQALGILDDLDHPDAAQVRAKLLQLRQAWIPTL